MARKKDRDDDDDRPRRNEPVKRDGAYVMMLSVTLVAIATGCVLLYLDFNEYGGKTAPTTPPPVVMKLGEAPKADPVAPAPPAGGDAAPKGDVAPKGSDAMP